MSNGHPDKEHEKELHRFPRATITEDGTLYPPAWWKLNERSGLSIAKIARIILVILSSSVASEVAFSEQGEG